MTPEKFQEFLDKFQMQSNRITKEKEKLRRALNEKGFNIPPGLTLSEWIPYIRQGDGT